MTEYGAPTILHVEDEELNRALLRAMLSRSSDARLTGAKLEEATTLARAREILRDADVDLVLMDVRLPDGSGLDLVREIKADRPELGIVVMSASVLPEEREHAMHSGCDAFLGKPYVAADLMATIRRFLPGPD
jgi:two-component system KDP operon response regulator KdpE